MQQTISVKKRIFSIFLILIISLNIIFLDTKKVQAVIGIDDVLLALLGATIGIGSGIELSDDYHDWYDNYVRPKFRDSLRELVGVISGKPVDPAKFDELFPYLGPDLLQELRIIINKQSGTPVENITDDMCKQYIYNAYRNSVVNEDNDSFTMSSDLNFILHHFNDVLEENSGSYYVYPFSIDLSYGLFGNGTYYQALRDKIREIENEGNYLIVLHSVFGSNPIGQIAAFPYENDIVSLYYRNGDNGNGTIYQLYNQDDWGIYSFGSNSYLNFTYDSNTSSFISSDTSNGWSDNRGVVGGLFLKQGEPLHSYRDGMWTVFLCSKKNYPVKVYKTLSDLKAESIGYSSYYVNEPVYNNWSNSTGDYTVTTSNYNPVSYGDITNYIDSFNTENGSYPNLPDINNFIENFIPEGTNPTPTPNPNNPSGGGGGSANATANNEGINVNVYNNHTINFGGGGSVSGNGTVSGNDIQDGGGVGNIFSFLSQIGDVLGSLIKNVGHVLAELVSGISETISALLEGIPTVFGDFMGALLGWLPEELRALITLGISAMIIVGVIKLFRG